MKKLLLLVLLGVVAGAVYYLFLSLPAMVKRVIESAGSDATRTKVQVSAVQIGLMDGKGAIQGFTIANPPDFREPKAFSLGGVQVKVDPSTVTKDPVVVDEVIVQAPEVVFEVNPAGQANMNVLRENLAKVTGGGGKTPSSGDATQKRFVIRRFVMEGGKVTARIAALGDKPLTAKLDRFVLTNIGGEGKGATPEEIARKILTTLVDRVRQVAARQGLNRHLKDKVSGLRRRVEDRVTKGLHERLNLPKEEGQETLKRILGR